MGGSTTSTQTSTSTPWKPSEKALKDILGQAGKLYDKGKGFEAYGTGDPSKKGWVPYSSETEQALQQMTSLASQPNPFYAGSSDFTNSLITGGQTLDPSMFQALAGQDAISVNPQLQSLLGQGATAIDQYGRPIASGQQSVNTEADYRSLFNAVDPEFDKVVEQTANTLGDEISRQFGGASYGSAAHTGTITDQIGDVVSQMYSDNFNQNLANKTNILGSISGVQGQNISNQLGAAGMLSGEQAGNQAAKASILGQIGGFQGQNADFQRGIAGDIANLSQQDIANRLSGIGVADQVYQSQYLPSQMLAGVGAARDTKAAEKLQADMDKYSINNMSDWDRLMQYFGIASGTGAQGNRTTTSVSQPSDPWSSIIGGGLLGSQFLF